MFHVEHRAQRASGPLSRYSGRGDRTSTRAIGSLAALALLACVAADAAPAPIDPALLQRLQAADANAARIPAMSADFEQKKVSPLLKKPLVSRGVVYAAGDAMLWDTQTPEPTKLRIDGRSLRLLYVQQKVLEEYPVTGKLATLAASPLPRLAALREKFDIAADTAVQPAAGTLALVLTPRDAELRQYVARVRVTLDEATGTVRHFELTDPDGERTDITFGPARTLAPDTRATTLDVPADVKTVRPLGPAAP